MHVLYQCFHAQSRARRAVGITLFTLLWLCATALHADPSTALRDYVNAPDPAYRYTEVGTIPGAGYEIRLLRMTSQHWRTISEVDQPVWEHPMAVIIPNQVDTETGMLIVAGGSNGDPNFLQRTEISVGVQMALASHSVVAVIGQVPNQPLFFPDASAPLSEDRLIAYSWDKAMDTGDYSWPVYLPMTKSVVRAMDTLQTYVPNVTTHHVANFVVVGFSKRAAATWLTAVVDPRVKAISPGVIDFLNLAPHLEHHFRAYGFYAPAVQDYVDYDIVRRVRLPEAKKLFQVVDPYSYRHLLTMPKFMINSPGDQFFLPDSARFYLKDLQGETLIRYVPNSDHTLSTSTEGVRDALTSLVSWYQSILADIPRPHVSWSSTNGTLSVRTSLPPLQVRLWQATNSSTRDFRRELIGEAWQSSILPQLADGSYEARVLPPVSGWTAYYVELGFPGVAGIPQTYSTPVYVTPDTLPFALTDPLGKPKDRSFWKLQVNVALGAPEVASVDATQLAQYFPFPIFDEYVTSIQSAGTIFNSNSVAMRAKAECLAVRLNVASGQLGWYTPIVIKHFGTKPLWQYWQKAYTSFNGGSYLIAKEICECVNKR